MYQTRNFSFSRSPAPKVVKWTALTTVLVTFFSLFSNALFTQVLGLPGLQSLLSLSVWGIHKLFFWQFFSFLFVQPLATHGISFGLLLHLFFDLYLLWAIGSSIIQLKGVRHFVGLYFGGAFFVGLVAYLSLLTVGSTLPFAGAITSIYILLISWAFLFPESHFMLFLAIPVKARWLVFGIIGVNLFLDFSNGNFFTFFTTFAALCYGYLYPVITWEIVSPFRRLHSLDKKLIYFKRKCIRQFQKRVEVQMYDSKIFDFKTGKAILNDEAFMDACLKKISEYGREGLTFRERWRMRRISKRKKVHSARR